MRSSYGGFLGYGSGREEEKGIGIDDGQDEVKRQPLFSMFASLPGFCHFGRAGNRQMQGPPLVLFSVVPGQGPPVTISAVKSSSMTASDSIPQQLP
jgi:hypothetical protein